MDSEFFEPQNFDGYPAVVGLTDFIKCLQNFNDGTGISYLVRYAKNLNGKNIAPTLLRYSVSIQQNLFGNYPTESDVVPSSIFGAIFGLLGFIHLGIFIVNYSRGHYFWISFVWFVNCVMRMIGFALRARWGHDISQVSTGLASEVFLVIPSVILVSFDLILAQRLFTWRHPVGGSRKLFWGFMFGMYGIVSLLIALTIVASFVPYIYYLSEKSYKAWKNVVKATSIFVILYSLTSMILIGLSYLFPPTAKDENLYTYQPWWIESFSPFYFVRPGAAQEAEETFMKRNHNHRHAIRVIAATHHHYNMVEGLTNQRGALTHNVSMALIFTTTILIFIGSLFRCIVVFQDRIARHLSSLCKPVVMYICWGGFEALINFLYIIGRVDLRFYRPDILPAKVRAIITAEQSYFPSDNEEEFEDAYSVGTHLVTPEKDRQSLPYPHDDLGEKYLGEHDDDDDDNISDFHF